MTWNTSEEVRKSKRLISVGDADQGNVRSFKYLGHVPSDNPKAPHYITQQISWFSVIKMGRNQIQSLQTMKSDCQHESGSWRGWWGVPKCMQFKPRLSRWSTGTGLTVCGWISAGNSSKQDSARSWRRMLFRTLSTSTTWMKSWKSTRRCKSACFAWNSP